MNTEKTKILLDIYERFGDKAQAALDFVKANSENETKKVMVSRSNEAVAMPSNGIYIIYENGSYCKFSKDCKKDGAKLVGIVHDGHSLAVTLKDLGRFKLVKDYDECLEECELYIQRECDALNDWDCVARTKHIQEVGTDIPLKEGEYIPSLPMLSAMMYWRDRGLNEALLFLGGEPISDNRHWSSTEYNSTSAWYINGESGYILNNIKYGSYVVRAVCAWEI